MSLVFKISQIIFFSKDTVSHGKRYSFAMPIILRSNPIDTLLPFKTVSIAEKIFSLTLQSIISFIFLYRNIKV